MTATWQEISDRVEIEKVLVDYANAIDTHNWDLLDQVFTADARLDYHEVGDWVGDRAGLKAWLSEVLPAPGSYQHLTATAKIEVDGDRAKSRIYLHNPMPLGENGLMFEGHRYRDRWERTAEGWRIVDRYFEVCYRHIIPGD